MEEQNNMDFEEQKPKKPFPTKIVAVVASVVIAVGVGATALALSLGGNTEPAAHECNFGDWITTKEATCTAMGEKTRTCECGEKELFPVAKLSHSFSEWTVIDNATCRETGKEGRECACGEKETRIIDKLEHSYGDWIITKDATCKEEGSKYRVCSTCNLKIESNIEKSLNHTEVIDVAVAATCSEFGKTEGKHCSVCDKILVYQKKVAKLDHTDGEWITDAEATCTTNGSKHQVCSVCNDTLRTETTNAFGHTDGEWITDAEATCTTNGSRHQVCAVCNDTLLTETISAFGHTDGEWITDAEATCTTSGSRHQVCTVCRDTIRTESVAASHSLNKTIVNATPTSFAKLVYDCDNCDYSKEDEIAPINVSASLTGSGMVWIGSGMKYSRSFEVKASGGCGQYKYKFESGSNLLQDYSTSNEIEVYGNALIDLAVIKITVMDEAGQKTVYEIKGDGTYVDSYIIYD